MLLIRVNSLENKVDKLKERMEEKEPFYNAVSYGIQNNIKAIRLDVSEKNYPAINLYQRCGCQYIAVVDLALSRYGLDSFKLNEKLL